MDALKNTVEAASFLRKEQSFINSFSGMMFGGQKSKFANLQGMTRLERHAEVTFAEAHLLKALLSLITDSNMVAFLKEGLAIRQSYNIFKTCYKFLVSLSKNGTQALIQNGVDSHFITSVYLGLGGFNLMLSILPARVLRIFEIIGFAGHRDFGMKCLALGANWPATIHPASVNNKKKTKEVVNFFSDEIPVESGPGTRKFMCDLLLSTYHVFLSTMIQLPGCNIPLATQMIQKNLNEHPQSFLYLIFKGNVSKSQRNLEQAIKEFNTVIDVQKDWRQLVHVCFWDIGICSAALGEWEKAAGYFDTLYLENKWSSSIYLYFKAVFLYTADKEKHKKQVGEMLKLVPTLTKKVAGKSIPLEVRRAN